MGNGVESVVGPGVKVGAGVAVGADVGAGVGSELRVSVMASSAKSPV